MKKAFAIAGLAMLALTGCKDEDKQEKALIADSANTPAVAAVASGGTEKIKTGASYRYEGTAIVEYETASLPDHLCLSAFRAYASDAVCVRKTGAGPHGDRPQRLQSYDLNHQSIVEFIPAGDKGLVCMVGKGYKTGFLNCTVRSPHP